MSDIYVSRCTSARCETSPVDGSGYMLDQRSRKWEKSGEVWFWSFWLEIRSEVIDIDVRVVVGESVACQRHLAGSSKPKFALLSYFFFFSFSERLPESPSLADLSQCHSFSHTAKARSFISPSVNYRQYRLFGGIVRDPFSVLNHIRWEIFFFLNNECFLWKLRHVNHRVTPGLVSREQPSSKSRHIIRCFLEAPASNPDRLYPDIWSMSTRFPLSCEQMLVLSFPEGLIRPENRPSIRPLSLGNVNLYFSSHREKKKLLRATECAFRRLGVLDQNANSRWYEWKSSVTFSPAAAYCQSPSAFWTPLNPFDRL